MRKILNATLIFVVLFGLTACGLKTSTWQEQYDLGVRYLSEGNYEEAIIAFTAAIDIDPHKTNSYLRLADSYEGIGNLEQAEEILKRGYQQTGAEALEQARVAVAATRLISDEQRTILQELFKLFQQDDTQGITHWISQNESEENLGTLTDILLLLEELLTEPVSCKHLAFDGEAFRANWSGTGLVLMDSYQFDFGQFYFGDLVDGIPHGDGIMFKVHTMYPDGNIDTTTLNCGWSHGFAVGEGTLNDFSTQDYASAKNNGFPLNGQRITCTFNSKEIMIEGNVTVWVRDSDGEHTFSFAISNGKAILADWDVSEEGVHKICEAHGGTCGIEIYFYRPGQELYQNTLSWVEKDIPIEMENWFYYGLSIGIDGI